MKALVVYYSRTGFTRKAGLEIAKGLGADSDEVFDLRDRSGAMGYLRAGRDAMKGNLTEIRLTMKNLGDYDLVVVGTPIWAWTVSSPIRTYLSENRGKFKSVAFFCTEGGSGAAGAFKAMEELCALKPKAHLELLAAEVSSRRFDAKVREFVRLLNP